MKLLHYGKDGGPDSTVWGFWLIEWKRVFSIALLCFEDGSREAYHSHAFNSVSWLLSGFLAEDVLNVGMFNYRPSWKPIVTVRNRFHKVMSVKRSWVLTFRGPWKDKWHEWLPGEQAFVTLTNGRQVVEPKPGDRKTINGKEYIYLGTGSWS